MRVYIHGLEVHNFHRSDRGPIPSVSKSYYRNKMKRLSHVAPVVKDL